MDTIDRLSKAFHESGLAPKPMPKPRLKRSDLVTQRKCEFLIVAVFWAGLLAFGFLALRITSLQSETDRIDKLLQYKDSEQLEWLYRMNGLIRESEQQNLRIRDIERKLEKPEKVKAKQPCIEVKIIEGETEVYCVQVDADGWRHYVRK